MKALRSHCSRLREFAWQYMWNGATPAIKSHARTLYFTAIQWQMLTQYIGFRAMKDKNIVGVTSVDFLLYSGHITLAQHWLKMEIAANEKLKEGKGNKDFYESKILVCPLPDFVLKYKRE